MILSMVSVCRRLLALPGVVLFTASAGAQSAYLPVTTSWETVNGVEGIRVMMAGDSRPLMEPNGQPVVSPTQCTTSLTLQTAPGGFDLLVTVENQTGQPQVRPAVSLSGVRLDERLTFLDGKGVGTLQSWDATGLPSKWSGQVNYPDYLYSPVQALFDTRFAIGVSLIYDILAQRHTVAPFFGREGGIYSNSYKLVWDLFARDAQYRPVEFMAPGASESYRLTVRFAAPARWLDTLEPYRTYFQGRYGGVQYQADRRPIWGTALSMTTLIGVNPGSLGVPNPRGYSAYRVDVQGWGHFVDARVLNDVVTQGYRRVMLWAPSGTYSTGENFPAEFMDWAPPMVDSQGDLDRLKAAGVTLGMWWGHSGHVSAGFNSGQMWVRDTTDPADMAAGDAELRLAVARGLDEIGLDAIKLLPFWERYPWLQRALQLYPSLRYVTENDDCDILHTIAPTFLFPWSWYEQEAVLADWLNPGHETWVQLWANEVTPQVVQEIRDYGLVPLTLMTTVDLTTLGCAFFVTPGAVAMGPAGGTATLEVATDGAGCTWTVASSAPWVTMTSATSGAGAGSVSLLGYAESHDRRPKRHSDRGRAGDRDHAVDGADDRRHLAEHGRRVQRPRSLRQPVGHHLGSRRLHHLGDRAGRSRDRRVEPGVVVDLGGSGPGAVRR